jgi:hypothetical protein
MAEEGWTKTADGGLPQQIHSVRDEWRTAGGAVAAMTQSLGACVSGGGAPVGEGRAGTGGPIGGTHGRLDEELGTGARQ